MHKIIFTLLLTPAFLAVSAQAQENKSLFSGANFLTIGPDARAGAMGSIGTSTAPDVNSIYWNAAKTVYNESTMEVSYTYSPWMREVADNMSLSAIGLYRKLDDKQAVSLGFRYFSYGKIMFTDQWGENTGDHKPYEMSIDLAYSRKLGEDLSAAVTLKYIRSQLGMGQMVSGIEFEAANAVAADIAVFYNRNIEISGKKSIWRSGLTLANIGSKLKYGEDSEESYLPGDLRLGTSLQMDFNKRNSLMLALEANSRMVPAVKKDGVPTQSGFGGYFSSFGNIQSDNIVWTLGTEYWYNKMIALRAGYHHGAKDSGYPTWFSTGFGIKYFNIMADLSYVAGISDNNPMRNSFQFSIGVDLDFFKK